MLGSILKAFSILTAAAAIAVFAMGCGDDDDGGGASAPGDAGAAEPLSKAEYLAQAKAICEQERREVLENLDAYRQRVGQINPEDVGVQGVEEVLLPEFEDEVERLRELGAPKGDETRIEAFLTAKEEAIETVRQRGLSANRELLGAFRRPDGMARSYGFESCTFS